MYPKTQTRPFPLKKGEIPAKLADSIPIASLDSMNMVPYRTD